jgi:zinc/manganese transport system permease protein
MCAAYLIGIAGYVLGLVLSAVLDLPSGALIVWTLAACGIAAQWMPAVRRTAEADAAPAADAAR